MTAQELAELFQRVLEVHRVAHDDNFFMLGGDSLLATRVISAVARASGQELALADFMKSPTPDALAQHVNRLNP